MMNLTKTVVLGTLIALLSAGTAGAATDVSADIAVSTPWTKAGSPYRLKTQIYVLPGATLTIEAGVQVISLPADQGSLAVCRGAKIIAKGTAAEPIIMTSTNDTLTAWHEGCNEWGNLTIMGNGLISASHYGGVPVVVNGVTNTKTPTGLNQKGMEGLVAPSPSNTKPLYGGANDDDDSGELHYVSLRYGGKVIGLANELNGLSLGGIGRQTEIDHIEIMNNVDDGIEIWGGTVNLKYVSIWNIGDDSFDVDEGWRGKAQFVLVVQGYSVDASQGSGVGDNCFEVDGAEDSDAQPVTTGTVYNATLIGQPVHGDQGLEFRDNARVQYRNMVIMNTGDAVVKNQNVDGDGANGYGYNSTLSWVNTWTTPYTTYSTVNSGGYVYPAFNSPQKLYQAQSAGNAAIGQGYLIEVTDSVFYQNAAGGYTEAISRGVLLAGPASNPAKGNVYAASTPIVSISRAGSVTKGGLTMVQVNGLDPRAANDAVTSVSTAPADGFFTQAPYRGAFSKDVNWLLGWTATSAYGYHAGQTNPAAPAGTVGMTMSATFPTTAGVVYTVEQSANMLSWYPIGTITGNGGNMSVTDLSTFDNTKFYRVIPQ